MKLNNKGYLIIEIILAFMLAMTIVYFFFNLIVKLNNKNQDLYLETVLLNDKATVTNVIQTDLDKYLLTGYKVDDTNGMYVNLELKDTITSTTIYKKIEIDTTSGVTIKYGPCNSGATLDNCTIDNSSDEYYEKTFNSNVKLDFNATIISDNKITLPLKINDKDYGINIVINTEEELKVHNYEYSEKIEQLTLSAGTYKLEVWGAQGGTGSTSIAGGLGGYSVGTYKVTSETTVYIVVGGQGTAGGSTDSIKLGGYNGGGNSGYRYGGSGGGATHIATKTGILSELSSLTSDVLIVAGGGGGGANYTGYIGGCGGGNTGGDGTGYNTTYNAKGATQSAGGNSGGYTSGYYGTKGSFGQGGAGNTDDSSRNRSGGGGGGYYGGGGGGYRGTLFSYYYGVSGGGGGSGYVNTTLTYTSIYAGNEPFTSPSGSTETGHSGNGYARITKCNNDNCT